MSLIRGIRSIIHEYSRDLWSKSEQNENNVESLILETSDDDDPSISIANIWLESITLNAKIFAISNFDKTIYAESLKGQNSFGKNQIYATPNFHSASEIKNKEVFCSKILIKLDGEIDREISNDFELKFMQFSSDQSDKTDVIFEKQFETISTSFSEQYGSEKSPKLHPYGGYFFNEIDPEKIELCWFQILVENRKTAIRILTSSTISTKNPAKNLQNISLKNDILQGKCQILLRNKNTNESCTYKSNSAQKISSPNCLKIHFIKHENIEQ